MRYSKFKMKSQNTIIEVKVKINIKEKKMLLNCDFLLKHL